MRSRAFLIVLLFLTWSFSSGWYYVCKVKAKCPSSVGAATKELPAFTFRYGISNPEVNPSFNEFKTRIKERLGESNLLTITGLYDPNELNTTDFDNLGTARATAILQALSDIDPGRIVLSSKEISFGSQVDALDAVTFTILTKNQFVEETSFGASLYFDENINAENMPAKLEGYLRFIAIHENEKTIAILGYWYNEVGEAETSDLGLERANMIRDILIEQGFNPDQITTSSRGQSEPLADNTTESGIRENSRVEIFINE